MRRPATVFIQGSILSQTRDDNYLAVKLQHFHVYTILFPTLISVRRAEKKYCRSRTRSRKHVGDKLCTKSDVYVFAIYLRKGIEFRVCTYKVQL